MGNRKSIYKRIKQKVTGSESPEEDNIDPSLLSEGTESKQNKEEEHVPEDFIALFDDSTKEDVIRELYFLSMEYKKIKRDNELMNFRITKIEMQQDQS